MSILERTYMIKYLINKNGLHQKHVFTSYFKGFYSYLIKVKFDFINDKISERGFKNEMIAKL